MRLELTRRNRHYPLKVACIPISPPAPARKKRKPLTSLFLRLQSYPFLQSKQKFWRIILFYTLKMRITPLDFVSLQIKIGVVRIPNEAIIHLYSSKIRHTFCDDIRHLPLHRSDAISVAVHRRYGR